MKRIIFLLAFTLIGFIGFSQNPQTATTGTTLPIKQNQNPTQQTEIIATKDDDDLLSIAVKNGLKKSVGKSLNLAFRNVLRILPQIVGISQTQYEQIILNGVSDFKLNNNTLTLKMLIALIQEQLSNVSIHFSKNVITPQIGDKYMQCTIRFLGGELETNFFKSQERVNSVPENWENLKADVIVESYTILNQIREIEAIVNGEVVKTNETYNSIGLSIGSINFK